MEERRQMGFEKYGTPLQAFNGRNSLVDLYQELLDAVVYIRTQIEEDKCNFSHLKKQLRIITKDIPDGVGDGKLHIKIHPIDVEGLWSTYIIKIEFLGDKYILSTKKGVKGFNIPVIVHYEDGTWTAKTEKGDDIEITKVTKVIYEK